MITPLVRFSYLRVFEARANQSGQLKFSASLLIPKSDTTGIAGLQAAIDAAIQKGIDTNKFTKAQIKSLRVPLRDGDEEFEAGNRGPEYKGHFFFNASSDNRPGVVKAQKGSAPVPIFDENEFYSGCYGRADVNFFPYNQVGNRGVGVGLNNIMMVKEGDRLDGRMKAEDAFASFTNEEDSTDFEDDIPF